MTDFLQPVKDFFSLKNYNARHVIYFSLKIF